MKKVILTVILISLAGAIFMLVKNTKTISSGDTPDVHNTGSSVSQFVEIKIPTHETSVTNGEKTMADSQININENVVGKTQDVQGNNSDSKLATTSDNAEMVYINIALAKLKQLNVPAEERISKVTIQDGNTIIVTFPPPSPRMLAGDFIIKIDKATGEVLDIKIWR